MTAQTLPQKLEIVEVGPRDGLQNEKVHLSTDQKVEFIESLIAAGARRIEVASFVNPRAVPQMADAEGVCAALEPRADVTYVGLAMNIRGADRALATRKIDQIGAVCVASDSFAMANQGQTSNESVEVARSIIALAQREGKSAQVTIGASFGCPFEGEVEEDRVVAMASALAEACPTEIALADTIGVADPAYVGRLVRKVRQAIGTIPVRAHFHDTRGTGLANVWAAVCEGVRVIDASLGGLGGCPFAPNATGNVATEDVVYMLQGAGFNTGLELAKLAETNRLMAEAFGRQLVAKLPKAGRFPPSGESAGCSPMTSRPLAERREPV